MEDAQTDEKAYIIADGLAPLLEEKPALACN
jgi:hypothetical protein